MDEETGICPACATEFEMESFTRCSECFERDRFNFVVFNSKPYCYECMQKYLEQIKDVVVE